MFTAIATKHMQIVSSGKVQEMSNIVWAFAKLNDKSPKNANTPEAQQLFDTVASRHKAIIAGGTVQNMSNICWAFSKLEYRADELFNAVSSQHQKILNGGDVQAMSNTCWAFAKVSGASIVGNEEFNCKTNNINAGRAQE